MAAESPLQTPDLLFADALADAFRLSSFPIADMASENAVSLDCFPFDRSGAVEHHAVLAEYDVVGMMPPQPTGTAFRARHRVTGEISELRFFPGPNTPNRTPASDSSTFEPLPAHAHPLPPRGLQTPDDSERAERWQQAVTGWNQTLTALQAVQDHPNIQRVGAFGEIAGGYYVLLQGVEGRSLRQILKDEGARPLAWTLQVAAQIAQALDYAAGLGLWHGDLNPDTIVLYGEPPVARLREFGLGSLNRKIISAYTSPEQTLGNPACTRSDIYALGAVLYACLSARPPFGGRSREELCRHIQTTYPPPLLEQPVWARNVLARAMQHSPAYRYRLAVDIVTDLQFQRSPAPIKLEPRGGGDGEDENWTLGRGIPAMALIDTPPTTTPITAPTRKIGLYARFLGREDKNHVLAAPRLTLLQQIGRALGRSAVNPPAQNRSDALTDAGAEGANVPIHGFLGRFNRYMALQQYVTLAPDDPRKRGWRGMLLKAGIALPLPKKRAAHSAIFRLPVPFLRLMDATWPIARVMGPLALLAVCAHALMLVHTRRFVHVDDVRGRPMLVVAGVRTPVHAGDTLDAADLPELQTGAGGEITLRTEGVWLKLAPNSALKLVRLAYSPTRARRVELTAGQAWLAITPPAPSLSANSADGADMLTGQSGQVDIEVGGAMARALPDDGPALLQLTVWHGKAQVKTLQGQTRVVLGRTTRKVTAGRQLAFKTDGTVPRVTGLGSGDSKALLAGFDPALVEKTPPSSLLQSAQAQSLVAGWRGLRDWYESAQERLVMPRMDSALTALHLQPGAQDALEAARAYTTARVALDAITKSLAMEGEMPASLNLQTLADTGLDPKDRDRLLQCFEGKRLLAYKRLENGGCLLFGRVNNDAHTLLMARDGNATRVPEAQEEAELANADSKP